MQPPLAGGAPSRPSEPLTFSYSPDSPQLLLSAFERNQHLFVFFFMLVGNIKGPVPGVNPDAVRGRISGPLRRAVEYPNRVRPSSSPPRCVRPLRGKHPDFDPTAMYPERTWASPPLAWASARAQPTS